jgi:hypothetical protein
MARLDCLAGAAELRPVERCHGPALAGSENLEQAGHVRPR